jgi:hypothetical protein
MLVKFFNAPKTLQPLRSILLVPRYFVWVPQAVAGQIYPYETVRSHPF